jgi:hypothetical protein
MLRRLVVLALLTGSAALIGYTCWPRETPLPVGAPPAAAATPPAGAPVTPSTVDAAPPAPAANPAAASPAERTEVTHGESALPDELPPRDPAFVWIEVRDAADRRVPGVPVGLRVDDAGRSYLRWRGVTEANGRVRAPNPTTVPGSHTATAYAQLALPLAHADSTAIERNHPPRAPVRLVLPPTGRVVVVIDGDAANGAGADVKLRVFADETQGASFAADAHAQVEAGQAQFAFVGLGLRLEAEATRPGQNEPGRLVFDGPRAPAQQVFAHLALVPKGGTMIVAHIECEDGTPCRDTPLEYTIDSHAEHNSSSTNSTVHTGADSVLRLVLDDQLGPDAARTLQLRRDAAGDVQTCHAALPRPLHPGENDLGTLRLLRPALVCAGLVVDEGGRPVANATVRVQGKVVQANGESWRDEPGLQVRSATDGAFQVRGTAHSADLRAQVEADGFLPATSAAFPTASAGLRFVLQRAAALAGSVLLKPPLEAADVLVELRAGERRETARLAPRGDHGDFTFASLPPGTVEVRARAIGDLRGELVVPDVDLRAGETARDPRLQDVDLLQGLNAISFTVVDDAGAPLRDAMVFVLDGDAGQSKFEGLSLPHGNGRLFAHAPSVDVLAIAPDHRWARATLTDGGTVTLPETCKVHVRLPADALPRPGETLMLQMWPLDPLLAESGEYMLYAGLNRTRSGTGTLPWRSLVDTRAEAGEAVVPVTRSGRYRMRWVLQQEGRPEREVGSRREVEVPDAPSAFVDSGLRAADLDAARR